MYNMNRIAKTNLPPQEKEAHQEPVIQHSQDSRKRRQTVHADQEEDSQLGEEGTPDSSAKQSSTPSDEGSYKTMPIFLQNTFDLEMRNDPKRLNEVLKELKPNAKIKSTSVCKSGDIKLIAHSPHDENILRQEWSQEKYDRLKPRLPKEITANQEVIIRNIPTTISISEIRQRLRELFIDPKDIYRFNKKGSQDPSNNVKVTIGSKKEREYLLNNGLGMYNHHFHIVEGQALPKITQCFKCQKFGHNFFECKAETSTCVRCSGSHRLGECTALKESAKCSNCSGNHAASYKGCSHYKGEVKKVKDVESQGGQEGRQKTCQGHFSIISTNWEFS